MAGVQQGRHAGDPRHATHGDRQHAAVTPEVAVGRDAGCDQRSDGDTQALEKVLPARRRVQPLGKELVRGKLGEGVLERRCLVRHREVDLHRVGATDQLAPADDGQRVSARRGQMATRQQAVPRHLAQAVIDIVEQHDRGLVAGWSQFNSKGRHMSGHDREGGALRAGIDACRGDRADRHGECEAPCLPEQGQLSRREAPRIQVGEGVPLDRASEVE